MSNQRLPRTSPPALPAPASDASIDHALALLLADETEGALRWGAAALEEEPSTPSALIVTSLLLWQMGRTRAAIDGLGAAVELAIATGNLPLAIAAVGDLRMLGVDVTEHLDRVSGAFCQGSDRLQTARTPAPLPDAPGIRPLSPFLTGPGLASRAAQILKAAERAVGESFGPELPLVAPLPLFSELPREGLRELLAAFDMVTVSAGHQVVREGDVASAAYIVARGELEVSRRISEEKDTPPLVLTRLTAGAFFGELALLSRLPSAASVVATRPSILLVARREAIEAIAARHPETGVELAAHCRRQSVSNLGWASPVLSAVPAHERAALVEMCETRIFGKGELLVREGDEALGLHLVISGEVGVIGRDGGERVVLATLPAGETVGEVELVLCRRSIADAIATRPTATLFLPRDEFFTLVQDHPGVLHALYAIAVRRHLETREALESGSAAIADDYTVDPIGVDETLLRSSPLPAMTALPMERPIVPARILSVASEAPATRTARMAVPTTTLRMPTPTPPGPPAVSARPESVGSTRPVSAQSHSTIAPTSATDPRPPRLRRSGFHAVAGGAIAVAGGVLIALVATHSRFEDTRGAAVGAARSTIAPQTEAEATVAATDPSPAPSATASALSTAPRVSRSPASPPAPPPYRAPSASVPVARATPSTRETPVPTVAAPAASLPHAAVTAPPSPSLKPAAPKAQATADEYGGRE